MTRVCQVHPAFPRLVIVITSAPNFGRLFNAVFASYCITKETNHEEYKHSTYTVNNSKLILHLTMTLSENAGILLESSHIAEYSQRFLQFKG